MAEFTVDKCLDVMEQCWHLAANDDENPEDALRKMKNIHADLEEYIAFYTKVTSPPVKEEHIEKQEDFKDRLEKIQTWISQHPLPE